jgi:hypothetical protein
VSYFSVKRYARQSGHWDYISYYDSNNNFRGKAESMTESNDAIYETNFETVD